MAQFSKKEKMIIGVSMGALVVFGAMHLLSSRGPDTSDVPLTSPVATPPAKDNAGAKVVVIDSVPGTSWEIPAFSTKLDDEQVAKELEKWIGRSQGNKPQERIATPSMWIIKLEGPSGPIQNVQVLPKFKQFIREDPEVILYDASPELQALLKTVVGMWYRDAQTEGSALSTEDKDRLRKIYANAQP